MYRFILLLIILLIVTPAMSAISANSTDILISRGDGVYYTERAPTDSGYHAWAWIFSSTRDNIDPTYDKYFGIPLVVANDGTYRMDLSYSNISNLRAGSYDMLVQFEGKNNIREVYYDKNTTEIASIYKDIKNVFIGGSVQASFAEGKLIEMFDNKTGGLPDDQYIIKNLIIQDPYITLDDVYPMEQYTNVMKIKGHTNLNAKHWIYIYYDEDESQKHGVMVTEGDIPGDNTFEYELSVPAQQMSTGQHFITVKSDLGIYTTGSFTIGIETTPTIRVTPTPYKYIYKTSNGQPATIAPTPTPRTVYVTVTATPAPVLPPQIVYVTMVPTPAPPTMIETTTASVSNNIIPIAGFLVLCIGAIALRIKQKRNKKSPPKKEYKLYEEEEDLFEDLPKEEPVAPKKSKKPKALVENDFEL